VPEASLILSGALETVSAVGYRPNSDAAPQVRGEIGINAFWEGLPEQRREKVTAVSAFRTRRARN
jgi:hypothetical protein